MIIFQNGIRTNEARAEAGAKKISEATGTDVGYMNNDTEGVIADGTEFVRKGYSLHDALNAYTYEQLAKNGDEKNLVVMHSAGNKDGLKGLGVLALEGRDLEGKVDFISIGSPVSGKKLDEAANKVGGNFVGQYNNWKDPVTNLEVYVAGGVALGVAAGYGVAAAASGVVPAVGAVSSKIAASSTVLALKAGIESASGTGAGAVVKGAGVGAAPTVFGLLTHPIERYVDNNHKGLKLDLRNWAYDNGALAPPM